MIIPNLTTIIRVYAVKREPPKPPSEPTPSQSEAASTPSRPKQAVLDAGKAEPSATVLPQTPKTPTPSYISPSGVVFQTVCFVAITFPEVVPPFAAEVVATIHKDTNSADIVMRDPVNKKATFLLIDFRDLEEPVLVSNVVCKLTCKSTRANSVILLSSDDSKTIESLFNVVKKLHSVVSRFAAQNMFSSSIRKRRELQPSPSPSPTRTVVRPAAATTPSKKTNPAATKAKPKLAPVVAHAKPTPVGDLLKLDEAPGHPTPPAMTLDNAINIVGKLYITLTSDYSYLTMKSPLDKKELRILAMEEWLVKDIISDEPEAVIDDLMQILEATMRLKTKVAPAASPAYEPPPQYFQSNGNTKTTTGIKYSLDDLRGLRIPCAGSESTTPSPVLEATLASPNVSAPNMQSPKIVALEAGFSKLRLDHSEKVGAPRTNSAKPPTKGLASSKWA